MTQVNLSTKVQFEFCHDRSKARNADVVVSYRQNVAQNALKLACYGFKTCPQRVHDLSLIAAAVAYADTRVRRSRNIWRRELGLRIPVYDLDFWRQKPVTSALHSVLSPLTGDAWALNFCHRQDAPPTISQTHLPISRSNLKILPYSHGLDSFIARELEMAENNGSSLILFTSGPCPPGFSDFRSRYGADRIEHVPLPRHITLYSTKSRREPSSRSRAFVFGVAASITAFFLETDTILIPEAGQGGLGPWLDPIGPEAADIRNNPIFTQQLALFIKLVLGHEVSFKHPYLWQTKGQTLRQLVSLNLQRGWETTLSCPNRRYYTTLGGVRVNCGACGACLLRRQSLAAAGLDHGVEQYLWPTLASSTLAEAATPHSRATTANDERQVYAGIAAMQRLANRADAPVAISDQVRLSELSRSTGLTSEDVLTKLTTLVANHKAEWENFCHRLGDHSFINAYRTRIRARQP